jgi:hypothetical protein
MELCEQAATEQDPKRLGVLVAAIIGALDAKEKRLKHLSSNPVPAKTYYRSDAQRHENNLTDQGLRRSVDGVDN